MFCKFCGNQVREGAAFCPACGSDLRANSNQQTETERKQTKYNVADNIQRNNCGAINMKKLIPGFAALVAVITIIVGIISFAPGLKEISDFKKAIKSRNIANVCYCYNNAQDYKTKSKFDKIIGNTIDDMQKDLEKQSFEKDAESSGSSAVANWARKNWGDLITGNGDYDVDYDLYDILNGNNDGKWDDFEDAISYAEEYCRGIYNYKHENNYFAAISNFSDVGEDSAFYENAQAELDECFTAYMQNILKEVDSYASNNDMGSGIELLNKSIEKLEGAGFDPKQLKEKLSQITVEYAKAYYDKAEEAFKNKDIDTAIGNMEVAVELQPLNKDYAAKLENYKLYIPFPLYVEDNILNYDCTYILQEDHITANDGSKFDNNISFWNYGLESGKAKASYYLAGKYNTVTGKFLVSHEYIGNNNVTGYFEARGDGKLIYTSPKIGAGIIPKDISFDVTGVQNLELSFIKEGEEYYCPEFYTSNLQAQKTISQ